MSNFLHKDLSNGAKLTLFPQDGAQKTVLNVRICAGRLHDKKPGTAHMLEHVLTHRQMHLANDIISSQFSTGWDYTDYRITLLPEKLKAVSQSLFSLLFQTTLEKENLQKAKRMVALEVKSRAQQYDSFQDFVKSCYGALPPYTDNITGSETDIDALEAGDLALFYRHYYTASHVHVALTGNIPDEATEILCENLSTLPTGEALPATEITKPNFYNERNTYTSNTGFVQCAIEGPSDLDKSYTAFSFYLNQISSMLYTHLREEEGLVYDFGFLTEHLPFATLATWSIPCTLTDADAIAATIEKTAVNAFNAMSEEDFKHLKADYLSQSKSAMLQYSPEDYAYLAYFWLHKYGESFSFDNIYNEIESLSFQALQEQAQHWSQLIRFDVWNKKKDA